MLKEEFLFNYIYIYILLYSTRLYLAAMHFNENAHRLQATTSYGELMYRMSCPKYKKGEGTCKPIKTPATLSKSFRDCSCVCVLMW